MKVTEISIEALKRYFNTLSVFGYKSYNEVYKLIVLLLIEELLTGNLSINITEDDYKVITNSLECLYGSTCLIDFPSYDVYDSLLHDIKSNSNTRITEDSTLYRTTEIGNIRVIQ